MSSLHFEEWLGVIHHLKYKSQAHRLWMFGLESLEEVLFDNQTIYMYLISQIINNFQVKIG